VQLTTEYLGQAPAAIEFASHYGALLLAFPRAITVAELEKAVRHAFGVRGVVTALVVQAGTPVRTALLADLHESLKQEHGFL
jgi:hypothetical protein